MENGEWTEALNCDGTEAVPLWGRRMDSDNARGERLKVRGRACGNGGVNQTNRQCDVDTVDVGTVRNTYLSLIIIGEFPTSEAVSAPYIVLNTASCTFFSFKHML